VGTRTRGSFDPYALRTGAAGVATSAPRLGKPPLYAWADGKAVSDRSGYQDDPQLPPEVGLIPHAAPKRLFSARRRLPDVWGASQSMPRLVELPEAVSQQGGYAAWVVFAPSPLVGFQPPRVTGTGAFALTEDTRFDILPLDPSGAFTELCFVLAVSLR
jgi:hypothetical protein